MSTKSLNLALVFLTIISVAGCFNIPKAELSQYKQTFAEANNAAENILLDYDQVLKQARARQTAANQEQVATAVRPPYPTGLERFEAERGGDKLDDIEVRRRAFRVIARYNDVLTQLAEGRSVEQVKSSASGLVNTMGKFVEIARGSAVPGLSAVVSLVSTVAEQFERARTRAQFVRAVHEGRRVIVNILDALIGDRKEHYNLRAVLAQEERLLILEELTIKIGILQDLVASHGPPPQSIAKLDDIASELNSVLEPVKHELVEHPIKLESAPASAGKPTYTEAIHKKVDELILQIKPLVGKYEDNVTQVHSLGAALIEYRKLLEKTKTALTTLERALDKPQDISVVADDLARTAFSLKRDLESLRAALRSAK